MKKYYAEIPVITYVDVEVNANSEAEAKQKLKDLDIEYWNYVEENKLKYMVSDYEDICGEYDIDNMAIVEEN